MDLELFYEFFVVVNDVCVQISGTTYLIDASSTVVQVRGCYV